MGPTNVALVKLFIADQQLREAQGRLDAATKDVRLQDRRVNTLLENQKTSSLTLKESQSKAANLELDLRSRDEHIEKLRTPPAERYQQQGIPSASGGDQYLQSRSDQDRRRNDEGAGSR